MRQFVRLQGAVFQRYIMLCNVARKGAVMTLGYRSFECSAAEGVGMPLSMQLLVEAQDMALIDVPSLSSVRVPYCFMFE